jgi:hypothetical protein
MYYLFESKTNQLQVSPDSSFQSTYTFASLIPYFTCEVENVVKARLSFGRVKGRLDGG